MIEACVKNCGSNFHDEVATKDFMEFMKDQAKVRFLNNADTTNIKHSTSFSPFYYE